MLRSGLILILLLLCLVGYGQTVHGVVLDDEHKAPIANVSIVNKQNGSVALTDSKGHFTIVASVGDALVCSHMSYEGVTRYVSAAQMQETLTVTMVAVIFRLQQVIVSGRTKYQQDSAEMHELFDHELKKPPIPRPKYTGVGCAGCFGWLADKITGNSKKPKRFKKHFAADDQQQFIDSRYNEQLVSLLTGITDQDSVAAFIYRYPLEYSFARAATDLELKAWVRYNHREFRMKGD